MDDIRRMEEETKNELDEVIEQSILYTAPLIKTRNFSYYNMISWYVDLT